jgi:hypothetical protein
MITSKSERKVRLRLLRQSRLLTALARAAAVRDTLLICELLSGGVSQTARNSQPMVCP